MRNAIKLCITLCLVFLPAVWATPDNETLDYDTHELAFIRSLGPWPPVSKKDESNRFSQQEDAIELGRQLFFDRRLSLNNTSSCADCHQPDLAFQDGVALNTALAPLHRNTTSLLNLANRPWYGWGGEHDSLWSQSIRPMLATAEMHTDLSALQKVLSQDSFFQCAFQQTTGLNLADLTQQDLLVTIGKLLASYQETIQSGKSRFDLFRDQLVDAENTSPSQKNAILTAEEQVGLKIFIGEGRCTFCHSGAHFSNGEFGDIGVSFFTANGIDKGRYDGIKALRTDPYSLLGRYNDATKNSNDAKEQGNTETIPHNALRTSHLQLLHRNWGEFKVPSLRNVGQTAPYMHNGSISTLMDTVDFYSELDEERLHADGEKILRPLHLTPIEKDSLQAFLLSLSGPIHAAQEKPSLFSQCR
ncbi:hypothetical protein OFY17_12160 [Marinomonas sp. C2222]|uniref:Cytochrome c domain-containing protein n=1 Tax=Marinomonas sargassi TaxID=2984494 RepID=A0ABT2YUR4_9GAMM|nr:cytochrome c peroxidase [Marinomonas sargassi]MCV2403626.1 hypothetical protein [Marinomonas sargassi]